MLHSENSFLTLATSRRRVVALPLLTRCLSNTIAWEEVSQPCETTSHGSHPVLKGRSVRAGHSSALRAVTLLCPQQYLENKVALVVMGWMVGWMGKYLTNCQVRKMEGREKSRENGADGKSSQSAIPSKNSAVKPEEMQSLEERQTRGPAHRPWTVWTAHSEMSPGQCGIPQQPLPHSCPGSWVALPQRLDIWPRWPLLGQSILPSVSGNASDSLPVFSLTELLILCSQKQVE